jgi:hypothetical protein
MRVAGIALLLSAIALGLSVISLKREPPAPDRAPARNDRVADLEADVEALTREVEMLKVERAARTQGSVPGLPDLPQGEDQGAKPLANANAPEGTGNLEALVDQAVEKKTEKVLDAMRVKANKKPPIDVFAAQLNLTDEQRAQTERIVVAGQQQLHAILSTPTYDGTNLLDQLVEIAAHGMAEPGKDAGFGLWLGRVLTEKIPGTDETYGTRIETVKKRMRAAFQKEWSDAQFKEFESWGVDPTEIEKVPGSPNEGLVKRITERARALGANLPKD